MLHRGFRISDYLPTRTLVDLLQDTTQPTEKRLAACLALGSKNDEQSFNALMRALDDDDWRLRRWALEALLRHENAPAAEDAIIGRLFDVSDEVRQVACKACARLKLERAHDGVLQLLQAESAAVRDTALASLRILWREPDFEQVFRMYREDSHRGVRIAAAKVLRAHATPRTWSRLFEAWALDREVRHRVWACELAGKFGNRTDASEVRPFLQDRNRNVRLAAVRQIHSITGNCG